MSAPRGWRWGSGATHDVVKFLWLVRILFYLPYDARMLLTYILLYRYSYRVFFTHVRRLARATRQRWRERAPQSACSRICEEEKRFDAASKTNTMWVRLLSQLTLGKLLSWHIRCTNTRSVHVMILYKKTCLGGVRERKCLESGEDLECYVQSLA